MATVKFGSSSISNFKVGTSQVSKIYHGTNLVWSPFSPVTRTYTSGSGTETAPSGATNVKIYAWGGGAPGGYTTRFDVDGATGGSSGALVVSSYPISGGQTLNYSVGAAGYYSGGTSASLVNATNSTITSGTKTITSMTAGAGVAGANGGTSPSASGGTLENISGTAGAPPSGIIGGAGGLAPTRSLNGTSYSGGDGGNGADGNDPVPGPTFTAGYSGAPGRVIFYYT